MCTVSWKLREDGFDLFFNRDELKTRSIALPPAVQLSESMPYIAPMDPDGGGTWIAVNTAGIGFFILNNYQNTYLPDPAIRKSRGGLIDGLVHFGSIETAVKKLCWIDLTCYEPFTIGMIAGGEAVTVYSWDGFILSRKEKIKAPISSSSAKNWPDIAKWRRQRFAQIVTDAANTKQFIHFHSDYYSVDAAASVCMRRKNAVTVSLSHISATQKAVTFNYKNGAPDAVDWQTPVVLLREARQIAAPRLTNLAE
ncbi:MAG: NRDE family protein [Calditrichia bacterium]